MTTYPTPAAAVAYLTKINAMTAMRYGASGPNNKLRRGSWEIDGRAATAAEARALNAIEQRYGARIYERTPGAYAARSAN